MPSPAPSADALHNTITLISDAPQNTTTSDPASAIASLGPGQESTTTARLLDLLKTPSYRVLDPFFFSDSWESRRVKNLDPQVKTL
jgi:hypothetical protein